MTGLPVTFSFLETEALRSKASFVKVGMREGNKRVQSFQVEEGINLVGVAQQQIHKGASFYRRVMIELSHHALAFFIVKLVYEALNDNLIEDSEYLQFSYSMFFKMRNRFDFLEVFVNMFLQIQDYNNIINFKEQLTQLRNSINLGAFQEYFYHRTFSYEEKRNYIVELFQLVQQNRPLLFTSIRGDENLKWKILQATVFIAWLERKACKSLKKILSTKLIHQFQWKRKFLKLKKLVSFQALKTLVQH